MDKLYEEACSFMKTQHRINVYGYQKAIVCSLLASLVEGLRAGKPRLNYFVSIPPSHGKSILISLLSKMLLLYSKNNEYGFKCNTVFIVCTNIYLAKHA